MKMKKLAIILTLLLSFGFSQIMIPDTSKMTSTEKMMWYQNEKKSPARAIFYSWLIPTSGHAYAGDWNRGLIFKGSELASFFGGILIMNIPPYEFLREGDKLLQVPELKIYQPKNIAGAPTIKGEDYISIPLTDSSIAAGQPIIQENNIEDYVLLHIRAAGKRKNLVASRVDGDSMEPMLHSGDIVVIDRDDKKLLKNRIFAIYYDEGLTAKYVECQKDLLILRPINPISQVQIINLNELPDPIVGRVIGAWKEL